MLMFLALIIVRYGELYFCENTFRLLACVTQLDSTGSVILDKRAVFSLGLIGFFAHVYKDHRFLISYLSRVVEYRWLWGCFH